jgi:hypothetical protein
VRRVDRALDRPHDEAHRLSGLATTLSRTFKPVARDGLVRIVPGEKRRTWHVAITAAREAALEEARPLWHSVQDHIVTDAGKMA